MVTKAEKIFFLVVILFFVGTAIFWREIRTYLAGSRQEAKTESTQKKKKEAKEKPVVESNAGVDFSELTEALHTEWKLPADLKEISGLASIGDYLWAISDKPKNR